MTRLALIGVPSSAGARRTGQEGAPAAFRAAGLLERLRGKGLDVADLGDLPLVRFRPDPDSPRHQNLARVVDVAGRVAETVEASLASHRWPLVLGGDCSVSLGVVAGMVDHHPRLGLLYFDGDVDLNTPDTTRSGILDGMVLAHVLGRGAPELAEIGPRLPLLLEESVVLFGYDIESGGIDPAELDALDCSRMSKFPASSLRRDPAAAARAALREMESRSDAFLVHFDVDVMSFAAADVPHPRGLVLESAMAALGIFVSAPTCAGAVVTEVNVERDPEGYQVASLVGGLVEALGSRSRVGA